MNKLLGPGNKKAVGSISDEDKKKDILKKVEINDLLSNVSVEYAPLINKVELLKQEYDNLLKYIDMKTEAANGGTQYTQKELNVILQRGLESKKTISKEEADQAFEALCNPEKRAQMDKKIKEEFDKQKQIDLAERAEKNKNRKQDDCINTLISMAKDAKDLKQLERKLNFDIQCLRMVIMRKDLDNARKSK